MNTADHDANELVRRVQLDKSSQVTLPTEVRDALQVDAGDEVEFTVHPNGDVTLRRWTKIPADQAWFWTAEWQEGEREASAELAAGEGTFYADVDALRAGLNG